MHTVEPASDVVESLHLSHGVSLPKTSLFSSGSQFLHLDASLFPVSILYLPGEQLLHPLSSETPSADEYLPPGHSLQVVVDVALEVLLHFPEGQRLQAVLSALAKDPAGQSSHVLELY